MNYLPINNCCKIAKTFDKSNYKRSNEHSTILQFDVLLLFDRIQLLKLWLIIIFIFCFSVLPKQIMSRLLNFLYGLWKMMKNNCMCICMYIWSWKRISKCKYIRYVVYCYCYWSDQRVANNLNTDFT